jgi:hypothetical protein
MLRDIGLQYAITSTSKKFLGRVPPSHFFGFSTRPATPRRPMTALISIFLENSNCMQHAAWWQLTICSNLNFEKKLGRVPPSHFFGFSVRPPTSGRQMTALVSVFLENSNCLHRGACRRYTIHNKLEFEKFRPARGAVQHRGWPTLLTCNSTILPNVSPLSTFS